MSPPVRLLKTVRLLETLEYPLTECQQYDIGNKVGSYH